MVQELQVVRCFSCETFQTQIVKKSNKWDCKVCGIKQSITKVYGRGSGKDCRLHTQKLNASREVLNGSKREHEENTGHRLSQFTQRSPTNSCAPPSSCTEYQQKFCETSKWAEFIDEKKVDDHDDCNEDSIDNEQNALPKSPLSVGICSRKKRKYEKQKNSLKSPQEDPSTYSDEFSNIYLSKTGSNQRVNVKRFKTNGNVITENVTNDCPANDVVEDEMLVNDVVFPMSQSSKERELLQTNLEMKSGKKWGKYLANEPGDKNLLVSAENGSWALEADDSIRENWTYPHSSPLPTKKQFSIGYDNQTKCNDVDYKSSSSSNLSQFKKAHCESKSFDFKDEIPEAKVENQRSCTLSGKMFEQECDLSDIDLELNF